MEPITNPLETLPPTLLPPAMGERCVACGSLLARDQRYCLECGERNGEPRLNRMSGRPAMPETVVAAPPPRARRPRASASSTLVAGIGVLLLALGVGVEIGRTSGGDNRTAAAPPVRVVVPAGVAGTGTAAATATVTAAGGATDAPAGSSAKAAKGGKRGHKATAKATPTPAASATPPPTVKLGQKGRGKGYKNGKFTGDFFGN
jgi:hypothetical protein